MKSKDIIKNIYQIVASATNTDNNEYQEITDDIRLVIHEAIDKVHEKSIEMVDDTVNDIINRLNLEADGHKLDKDKLYKDIANLSDEIYDIYSDTDDKEISSGDLFKYSTTKMIRDKLNNKLLSGAEVVEDK